MESSARAGHILKAEALTEALVEQTSDVALSKRLVNVAYDRRDRSEAWNDWTTDYDDDDTRAWLNMYHDELIGMRRIKGGTPIIP